MKTFIHLGLCLALVAGAASTARAASAKKQFTEDFDIAACTFETTGSNRFFLLEPGHEIVLQGEDRHDGFVEVRILVTGDTEMVDGVLTRVVQEREWADGELVEISRNYFASCAETGDVYYFGEEVDIYEDGMIASHDGAWRAGVDGARPGIIMPGTFLLGSRYYQEIAPGAALDRAEHVAMGVTIETEAGTFVDCVEVVETTPLEPGHRSHKAYAPGIGLIVDGSAELVEVISP